MNRSTRPKCERSAGSLRRLVPAMYFHRLRSRLSSIAMPTSALVWGSTAGLFGSNNYTCIGDDPERIEGILEQSGGDVFDAVEAQEVQTETPEPRQDARVLADAAGILLQGDVPDVMVGVLHAPVPADHRPVIRGCLSGPVGDVPGHLPAGLPQAGRRDFVVYHPADPQTDQRVVLPLRQPERGASFEDFDPAVLLAPMRDPVMGLVHVERCRSLRQGSERGRERRLIVLHLHQELAAAGLRLRKGLLLAVLGIGGEPLALQAKLGDQRL